MISPDQLAARLADDDPDLDAAVARASTALAAWLAWPDCLRSAYQPEANRLARRAAAALIAVLEVADDRGAEADR